MKSRILITGANGLLGSAFCRQFSDRATVIAMHRDKQALVAVDEQVSIDITDRKLVRDSIASCKPNVVVHCAGLADVDLCEAQPSLAQRVNVDATRNLAASVGTDAIFVYISTDQVYGVSSDRKETSQDLNPVNVYGATKLRGEKVAAESCPRTLIIRTNLFGWNAKPNRVSSAEWIYHSLRKSKPITLFDDYVASPIYTGRLAEIVLGLIRQENVGVYNIGSRDSCSKYEFGIALARTFGLDPSPIQRGSIRDVSLLARRPNDLSLDTAKLLTTGYVVPNYLESLQAFAIERRRM